MSNAVSTTWPSGSTNAGWPQEPTGMLMPGRIQGWPAGTQRASSPATTLLSQAVAWWDVEQYRDGDRFLRNQGVAGELLNLRLGSSIVANTNDPLYLPVDPQGSGYVYLSGVAGNSLSMTAPATATQYIAYPLDRSTSTSTGSVTGGATFTFSTTGSWLKIELLDASNVVLDTIDCDAITSGSNTSFLSVGNQTVSVSRSTSGRKSVCVPSRHKGGRPVMLLGTDDFLQIPDDQVWQHGLLNFGPDDPFTVLIVYRMFATIANTVIAKKAGTTSATIGWALTHSAGAPTGRFSDGSTQASPQAENVTSGALAVVALQQAPRDSRLTFFPSTGIIVPATTAVRGQTTNTDTVRIGRLSGAGTDYAGCEFYGAAVWRRQLALNELKVVSDEMTRRIA